MQTLVAPLQPTMAQLTTASPQLESTSRSSDFVLGTGSSAIAHICRLILENARHEIIFVTCFWAESESSRAIAALLLDLSKKSIAQSRSERLVVRICLSSLSFWQKVTQTSSKAGQVFSPSTWAKKLGLPHVEELPGLDLQIKIVFIKPFSVIHSKYVIIDRSIAIFPSCNVSHEAWLEGAITWRGPIAEELFDFWRTFWASSADCFDVPALPSYSHDVGSPYVGTECNQEYELLLPSIGNGSSSLVGYQCNGARLLPSSHHRNPRFRPFPWQKTPPPPATRLNQYILDSFRGAKSCIFLQTPNLTCASVVHEVLGALLRGVDVRVVTNRRLMTMEQLVTAGITTPSSIKRLVRKYRQCCEMPSSQDMDDQSNRVGRRIGKLVVDYYDGHRPNERSVIRPVKTHLKLTIIDEETTILGSGNMDRASWYTSQEVGVAFKCPKISRVLLQQALSGIS